MKSGRLFVSIFVLAVASAPLAQAQFGSGIVYDPTQSAHAIQQIQQNESQLQKWAQELQKWEQHLQKEEQIYTTTYQTMNTVIQAYNLAYQMSRMPQNLAARYKSDFSQWTSLTSMSNTSSDTSGITSAWLNALVRLAQETNNFSPEQMLYHGLVKPREVEHDSQIYGAFRKEAERIKESGGRNLRVELDFELKSKVQKAIYAARKIDPDRDMDEIKREVAEQYELPYVHNKIEVPDARIHYDVDQGTRAAFSDIEVVTAAYRPGHIAAKAQAGFHMYASASDHSRLSKIEDEHHMLDWVMDL